MAIIPLILISAEPLIVFALLNNSFDFLLGVVLFYGVDIFKDAVQGDIVSRVADWLQLLVGVGLLIFSFRSEKKIGKEGRIVALRAKLASPRISIPLVISLALAAGLLEAATMLPYLGAINILSNADLGIISYGILLGYCLVMVLPAILLLIMRITLHERIGPKITSIEQRVFRQLHGGTGWLMALPASLLHGTPCGD